MVTLISEEYTLRKKALTEIEKDGAILNMYTTKI